MNKYFIIIFSVILLIVLGFIYSQKGLRIFPKIGVQTYTACGCGCCGGSSPARTQCLYYAKGDRLETIIAQDKKARTARGCQSMGCSLGVVYSYCD